MWCDVQKRALASVLYEKVLYHLDLVETDYFGLQYSDTSNINVSHSQTQCHRLYDNTTYWSHQWFPLIGRHGIRTGANESLLVLLTHRYWTRLILF